MAEVERSAEETARQLSRRTDPVTEALLAKLVGGLADSQYFVGDVGNDFTELVELTIGFLRYRYDIEPGRAAPQMRYLFGDRPDDGPPPEEDLAMDYFYHLRQFSMAGHAHYEVRGIGTGRVDVLMSCGTHEFSAEVKRELVDASRAGLAHYLPQAAAYPAADVRLGLLLVLDLTAKPLGTEAVEALMYVEVVPGASQDDLPRHIVVTKVPADRPSPSQLSRKKSS